MPKWPAVELVAACSLSQWQELNNAVPETKKDVLDQIVWTDNRFVKINKASIYFRSWHLAGVYKLSSLLEENQNQSLSFDAFLKKFKVKCNFLRYHGLLSAISSNWKTLLKRELQTEATVKLPAIGKLTCKAIYKSLVNHQNFPPPTTEKRLTEYGYGFDIHKRQKIYSLLFIVTKEVKLSVFEYKIIHNILYTNCILYKMKKVEDPHCPFYANIDQTVTHLFLSCPIAISFWSDFIIWYQSFSQKNLSLSNNEILYGVLNDSSSCSTLNHLILIGKYFLYCKALNNVKFQFADFTNLVYYEIETERYIAIMSNKYNTFFEKWSNFVN